MKISYEDIDKALDYFEQKNFSEASEKEFISNYPNIMSYLTSGQFEALTEDEYMILMFDSMILIKALSQKQGIEKDVDSDIIEAMEAENWDRFEALGKISFHEKTDQMLGKENEALNDFIISSFEDDEDEDESTDTVISQPAKEIIFITVKTIVDSIAETKD